MGYVQPFQSIVRCHRLYRVSQTKQEQLHSPPPGWQRNVGCDHGATWDRYGMTKDFSENTHQIQSAEIIEVFIDFEFVSDFHE